MNVLNKGYTDTRGKESRTLFFVSVAFTVSTVKWMLAGFTIFGFEFPHMSGVEYASMIAAILGIWLGREWTAKVAKNGET